MKTENEVPKNESVTLTVAKNSPHIWAGGLEGDELASWLIGKANAILNLLQHQAECKHAKDTLHDLESSKELFSAYVSLGLSLQEGDPIRHPSKEAIQFEVEISHAIQQEGLGSRCRVTPVPPLGYSHLPDLHEEQAKFQQAKADLSVLGSVHCEQKDSDEALSG